ncbi:microsomal signal peptidase 25 kDa subunit family protein [Striga asiatica]|uniref:Signal peptidase complex subunit 2 n=1 Tax=Striga asiatica TaxID=4170 RepID=A0A5A7RA28_STRAF|nr:microsomal signal peptidase 25 kDa subunit family protein [Striga asiatica]
MQEKKGETASNKNPKKANLLDHHSIKHVLDESVTEVVTSKGYPEDVRLSNIRLFLGAIIIVIALFAQFYNKKFPENRNFLIVCDIQWDIATDYLPEGKKCDLVHISSTYLFAACGVIVYFKMFDVVFSIWGFIDQAIELPELLSDMLTINCGLRHVIADLLTLLLLRFAEVKRIYLLKVKAKIVFGFGAIGTITSQIFIKNAIPYMRCGEAWFLVYLWRGTDGFCIVMIMMVFVTRSFRETEIFMAFSILQDSFNSTGLIITSKLPRFSDLYSLTIASADPKSISAKPPVEFTKSVTQWFTKDGVLVEGLFWKDVEGLMNDYAKESKKSK